MVGKGQMEMMDADGKPIIAEFIKIGKDKGKAGTATSGRTH
jgi:hypothetical protein